MKVIIFAGLIFLIVSLFLMQLPVSAQEAGKANFKLEGDTRGSVGDTISLKIMVSAQEDSNLFAAELSFPKESLEVVSIGTQNSLVKNWVQNFYDNKTGEISLLGGIPTPGFKGAYTHMATVTFKAKAEGNALIQFTDKAAIYSNSTNENILAAKPSVTVRIANESIPDGLNGPIKGDADKDGKLSMKDLSILLSHFQSSFPNNVLDPTLDLNEDHTVNSIDVSYLIFHFRKLGLIRAMHGL